MSKRKTPQQPKTPKEPLIVRLETYIDNKAQQPTPARRKYVITTTLGAIIIAGAASPFIIGNGLVNTLIGIPAGVLLFLATATLMRTRIIKSDKEPLKAKLSPRMRMRYAIIATIIAGIIFVGIGGMLPHGVAAALLATVGAHIFYFVLLTPTENYLDEEGLPDPRDVAAAAPVPREYEELPEDFDWGSGDFSDIGDDDVLDDFGVEQDTKPVKPSQQ